MVDDQKDEDQDRRIDNIEVSHFTTDYTDTETQHYLFTTIQSRSITPSTDKYDKILTWGCGNII